MNQPTRILVIVMLCLVASVSIARAAELKIGVIDPQQIFENTKKGKKIKGLLADYVQARQQLIQTDEKELKQLETELTTQASLLNAKAKEEKQQAFQQKMAAYQRRVQELEGQVQTKKREVLGEFTKIVEKTVQEIAEQEKIVLVVEKGATNTGTLVLYSQDSLDLTSRVIKELDRKGGD